jgi:hypothetical protein
LQEKAVLRRSAIASMYDVTGKRNGGRLIEEPEQQAAIRRQMKEMCSAGESLRVIAAAMHANFESRAIASLPLSVNRRATLRKY